MRHKRPGFKEMKRPACPGVESDKISRAAGGLKSPSRGRRAFGRIEAARLIWTAQCRKSMRTPPFSALPAGDAVAISRALSAETARPMAVQRTFSILKPDVTQRNLTGAINQRIEASGLRIVAQKRVHMTRAQAEQFYGVHRERPFFGELVEMMTAAPVVVQVLEGDDAIQRYRDVMGATNPAKAVAGTIRKDFALSMGENSVHGSDAVETAAQEIAQWFSGNEIVG